MAISDHYPLFSKAFPSFRAPVEFMKPQSQLLLGLLWFCAVFAGTGALLIYEHTPGASAASTASWPARAALPREPGKPTLIMFAHPRCPCTRASLGELSSLLRQFPGKVQATVLFMVPQDAAGDPQWTQSDLWTASRDINALTPRIDPDGAQAALFGAATSGQVLLYSPSGHLLFNGGVTASRGHVGPSIGQAAITSILNHQTPAATLAPVYGCSLFSPTSACLTPEGPCHP
jgi:hypothetical protein